MGLFNKFKKATEDIKKTIDEANIMEKTKEVASGFKTRQKE